MREQDGVQVVGVRGRESRVMGIGTGGLGPYEIGFNLCGFGSV